MDKSPDYRAGFNAGIDRAMAVLHERCASTFDPMLKAAKFPEPKQSVEAIVSCPQIYNPETGYFEPGPEIVYTPYGATCVAKESEAA